ncbi:MAG: CehA/McbA family metallohydrolase [Gammaproteobacteria bacterium]
MKNPHIRMSRLALVIPLALAFTAPASQAALPTVEDVPKQPLVVHVNRIGEALHFIGRPLSDADRDRLQEAAGKPDTEAVKAIQQVLDPHTLVVVDIDPNRKVTVSPTSAELHSLIKNGWTTFLAKVINRAGDTGFLDVDSPQAAMPYDFSRMQVERSVYDDQFTDAMLEKHFQIGTTWGTWGGGYPYKEPPQPEDQSPGDNLWPPHGDLSFTPTAQRWAAVSLYQEPPMTKNLSGLKLEYVVLQVYSRDEGEQSMTMSFNVGAVHDRVSYRAAAPPYVPANSGYRGETELTFDVEPPIPVTVKVLDEDGSSTAARFTVRDKLARVYPHRAKRYAPDLFFQNHIYRYDGETIELPPGEYTFDVERGPHYVKQTRTVKVDAGAKPTEEFKLERWFNPQARGWKSNDGHVHTAGCLHYNDPTYGLTPEDMLRYAVGEDLDIADTLIWGPNWYYQKEKYFTGKHPDPASTDKNIVAFNLEISQFPSSAGGHTSGHGIREIDYPGAKRMKDWPSYTLPILKWIQSQGGLSAYTHAGFGLDVQSAELPNYITPPMDSIGANEFIMTVAHGAADAIGVGNTNFVSELNIFYHTLNAGLRPQIRGETDWPCINGEAIGRGRSYVKLGEGVDYMESIKHISQGNSYVSDGRSHIMDFMVNGQVSSRVKGDEVKLAAAGTVKISAEVAAYLPEEPATIEVLGEPYQIETQAVTYRPMPKPKTVRIADLPVTGVSWRNIPWWHLERARIGESRDVTLEVVVNGEPVANQKISADGSMRKVEFDVPIGKSSWVALRILGASHTNPTWVLVENMPVRASPQSIEWCIKALAQAYEVKRAGWRPEDYQEATAAYDYAHEVYAKRLAEAKTR